MHLLDEHPSPLNMDVKKTIAELTSQLSEINYDSEEDNILLKDPNQSSNDDDLTFDIEHSKLRKATDSVTLPENVYGGRKTSRKRIDSFTETSDSKLLKDDEELASLSDEDVDSDSIVDDDGVSESEEECGTDSNEMELDEMVSSQTKKPDKENQSLHIYSAASKNVPNDVKKGVAIRNQLRIWESLLECRIKLQKGLAATNSLPGKEHLLEVQSKLDLENQQKLNCCKKNLLLLLTKLVDLQEELLKRSADYNKNKETKSFDSNDEIPSDDSGLENGEEKEEEEEDQSPRKKRKLTDYSSLLKARYDSFTPYRNASIQKWNDKTKVSTGKMANSNFSAFDQSTLKQIEQIMTDKSRLINRTRIKRNNDIKKNLEESSSQSQEIPLDAEIFDDTDFYHKLLRDYIERKSVDATNSTNTERQLIELQKLRSKMKRNVDTKSTKGRKLRYVVLPKLVNFMALHPYNTWSDSAETELYNSLFGKIKH